MVLNSSAKLDGRAYLHQVNYADLIVVAALRILLMVNVQYYVDKFFLESICFLSVSLSL